MAYLRSIEEMIQAYRSGGASEGDICDMVVDRLKQEESEEVLEIDAPFDVELLADCPF